MSKKLIRLFRPNPKKPSQSPFSIHFIRPRISKVRTNFPVTINSAGEVHLRHRWLRNPQSNLATSPHNSPEHGTCLFRREKSYERPDGLSADNMVMLILMSNLCQGFGFSSELFFGKILPPRRLALRSEMSTIGTRPSAWRNARIAKMSAPPYGTSIYHNRICFPGYVPCSAATADDYKEEADLSLEQVCRLLRICLIEFFDPSSYTGFETSPSAALFLLSQVSASPLSR